jgi:hypothetical protein
MSKHLRVLNGHHDDPPPSKPLPHEVVYKESNLDGTRKKCANCTLFIAPDRLCYIHDTDVMIDPTAICNYHVYGRPQESGQDTHREFMEPVTPELSGLQPTDDGLCCDICGHYTATGTQSGICHAVADPDEPGSDFVVAPHALCGRWTEIG